MPLPVEVATKIAGADHMVRRVDHRDQASFAFAREVRKPQGVLEPMLAWCRDQLQSDWRWQLVEMSSGHDAGRYIFYFDSEKDAVAFSLKWC